MKKMLLGLAAVVLTTMMACGNATKQQSQDAENDSIAADSALTELPDATPLPMFVMTAEDTQYMQMLYWSDLDEPQNTEENADWYEEGHKAWAIQDLFRQHKTEYINLLTQKGTVKVKFIDEVLKDPDGNRPSIGEIHGRNDIPSLCARFDFENSKKDLNTEHLSIIVTDSYLQSRQRLDINDSQAGTPLPQAAVKQLEQKYGMKVEASAQTCRIGKDYIWGKLQFRGEYKNAPKDEYDPDRKFSLALDVLIKGDEVYANENMGYYDPQWGCTWNADDDGEYVGCFVAAAFEGPKGLELCYRRYAPESVAVGMFYVREGQLIRLNYETYHWMIDEETPVWKSDIAKMEKIYHDAEGSDASVTFTKWAHCYIDYENEWIWLRDKDDENGAFFIRDIDQFELVAIETPKFRANCSEKDGVYFLLIGGPAGGPSWYQEIYAYKNGKRIWKFNMLKVEGKIDGAELDGKEITKEEAQEYLSQVPEGKEINVWFKDINE